VPVVRRPLIGTTLAVMAIFTAWGKHGHAYIFGPGEETPRFVDGTPVEEGLELIWRIEAANWNDAMRRYHELQGWEPYQPLSDDS
jgi:hypothetical protein